MRRDYCVKRDSLGSDGYYRPWGLTADRPAATASCCSLCRNQRKQWELGTELHITEQSAVPPGESTASANPEATPERPARARSDPG